MFKATYGVLKVGRGALIAMKGTCLHANIYMLEGITGIGGALVSTTHETMTYDTLLWHLRLGHMNEMSLLKLHACGQQPGVRSCKLDF